MNASLNFESTDPLPMTLTEFDLDNISNILHEPTKYNWYTAHLLRLCAKADKDNLIKLAHEYPDVVAAYLIYLYNDVGHRGFFPAEFKEVIPDWEKYTQMMVPHILGEGNRND